MTFEELGLGSGGLAIVLYTVVRAARAVNGWLPINGRRQKKTSAEQIIAAIDHNGDKVTTAIAEHDRQMRDRMNELNGHMREVLGRLSGRDL